MNCYLISLSGQGDVHTILVNDVAWDYLWGAEDGRAIPDELIQDYVDHQRSHPDLVGIVADGDIEVQARHYLSWRPGGTVRGRFVTVSADVGRNNIAMSMGGSAFGGERWNNYGSRDLAEMMAFMTRHRLYLVGEYEGYIY